MCRDMDYVWRGWSMWRAILVDEKKICDVCNAGVVGICWEAGDVVQRKCLAVKSVILYLRPVCEKRVSS